MPRFPHLEHDLKTDILIIGGGLAGILCAHRLAKDGVDYALIEVDRICHGVIRNTTAKITSQHGLIYGKLVREFGTENWEYRKLASMRTSFPNRATCSDRSFLSMALMQR